MSPESIIGWIVGVSCGFVTFVGVFGMLVGSGSPVFWRYACAGYSVVVVTLTLFCLVMWLTVFRGARP